LHRRAQGIWKLRNTMPSPRSPLAPPAAATAGAVLVLAAAVQLPSAVSRAPPTPADAAPSLEAPPVRPKPARIVTAPEPPEEKWLPTTAERLLPSTAQLFEARRFAAERRGLVAFAVVDTEGRMHCHRCGERHSTGSVVKAMLLVAYLERAAVEGRGLSAEERRQLSAMIRFSGNEAADAIYGRLGDGPLARLAGRAGMEGFSVRGHWGNALASAADQARFFARLNRLTPQAHRTYARELLSSIIPAQSWGLAESARPHWRVLFKGGWTPTRRGHLAHQAGRLERPGRWMAVAVLTDGNPSQGYGLETVRGIAERLLAPVE
jgi:hypothetical protein